MMREVNESTRVFQVETQCQLCLVLNMVLAELVEGASTNSGFSFEHGCSFEETVCYAWGKMKD